MNSLDRNPHDLDDTRNSANVLRTMSEVCEWLYKHTISFDPQPGDDRFDRLGAEISHLMAAITQGHRIELEKKSPLLYVLTDSEFTFNGTEPPPKEVWNYIDRWD